MTYEEKLAELEKLKAEIAGRPQFLGSWDSAFMPGTLGRVDDEFEGKDEKRIEVPLVIDAEEAKRLFPGNRWRVEKGSFKGRKGLPDGFVQSMYKSYLKGKSLREVGRIYGRSRQTVFETFKRRGLKMRPDSRKLCKPEFEYRGRKYAPGKDGYLRATSGDRKPLHHVIWEEFQGVVPAGHLIAFGDGNKRNFDLENLVCITKAQFLRKHRPADNQFLRAKREALERGDWKPKEPSKTDRAFLTWFTRHGWLIRESTGQFQVWTNDDAVCRFRLNGMMIERLAHAGLLVAFHPENEPFVTHWGLPERRAVAV